MEKPIEKECDRESFLKDNCDKVEEKGYTKAYKWKNYLGRENNASMCDIPDKHAKAMSNALKWLQISIVCKKYYFFNKNKV